MKVLVIFLHGSGGCGSSMSQFLNSFPVNLFNNKTVHDFLNSNDHNIQYDILTPTADARLYTPGFSDLSTNAWFDRSSNFIKLGRKDIEDKEGILTSLNKV